MQCSLFEQELSKWEENGDPLTAWADYLVWFEEKGLTKHSNYKQAVKKCIKYFNSTTEYNGERRLARIYISAVSSLFW